VDSSWHVVLRDISIMLAAGSVMAAAAFAVVVLWQLYRLAIELQDESAPILDAVRQTAETVQNTAGFVGQQSVPPAVRMAGLSAGAVRVSRELNRFYRGLRHTEPPRARLEG
jgi:hypothetical protein